MRLALALAALVLVVAVGPGWAENAGGRYATAYRVTGYRPRATVVCPGDKRTMTQRAFAAVSSPEFKPSPRPIRRRSRNGWVKGWAIPTKR